MINHDIEEPYFNNEGLLLCECVNKKLTLDV